MSKEIVTIDLLNQKFTNTATNVIYVDKNRADDYVEDGSILNPYKTIQDAIDYIASINLPQYFTINVINGIYEENLVLEDIGLQYIKIQWEWYVNINPTSWNALQSIINNWNLKALDLDNITFSKPVILTGSNGTTAFTDVIWNKINFVSIATFTATCINNISLKSCYSDQAMAFSNVSYVHMESCQNQGTLLLSWDSTADIPSRWINAIQIHPYWTYQSGTVSYWITGTATMEVVPNGCRRGFWAVVVPLGVTIFAHNSYLRGNHTNNWVIHLRNSFVQGWTITGTGTIDITNNSSLQIWYDNTTSGLTATNVKDAIDEIVSMLP